MAAKSKTISEGRCHICGVVGPLTFEHVPPKKAFNEGGGLVARLQDYLDSESSLGESMRYSKNRKGFGRFTLCERCNNNTGAWYGADYIDWAYQGARYLSASGSLALPYHIFPGRVAKQIIAMFASVNGPGFFDANPELRKFVLDREATGISSKFKLLCFRTSKNSEKARTAGVVGMISLSNRQPSIFSEIAFVPFGYILCIDSPPPADGLFDITFFCHERINQYRDLHLPIPARETHSYFPADFRNKEEWDRATAAARKRTTDV